MGHQYRRAGVSGRKELMAATTGSDELQQASFAGSGEISVWRFETWGRLMIVGTGAVGEDSQTVELTIRDYAEQLKWFSARCKL